MKPPRLRLIVGTVSLLCAAGCADKLQTLASDPVRFLEDPHFAAYQKDAADLEHAYLQKEIDYAEYQRRKKDLDERYDQEVYERRQVLEGGY